MRSMTSQGSPYARFRRALEVGKPSIVVATARELPRLDLAGALAVCLCFLPTEPDRYERALVRWHARYCLELSPGPGEAALLLGSLRALADRRIAPAGAAALEELLHGAGLGPAAEALARWCERRGVEPVAGARP